MADENYYIEDGLNEIFEMSKLDQLSVRDVTDLLQKLFAINTGGKTRDGFPIIIFPDTTNFHLLSDTEYQRLILYLTSVSSIPEADLGFHIVIDRRKDRWNSVKTVLLKISEYFPGLVRVVYVIRPKSFLQKALSEVSNKLFKEDFKFTLIVLSTIEELHKYIDPTQLTIELGGHYEYSHYDWIQTRILLENFSLLTKRVSKSLDEFTQSINESEFPNTVDSTQHLLDQLESSYSELKEEIMVAAKQGHLLLTNIREKSYSHNKETGVSETDNPGTIGSIISVERLLLQLEETEQTFDEFWQKHSTKLRQCLKLRRFEQDFRELQSNFDSHLKTISEMTEVGETVARVDTLIREMTSFEKLCAIDIERAEEVIASGNLLLQNPGICPLDCVEPKCSELSRITSILSNRLSKRIDCLVKCRELMERVEKANKWCAKGVDLLTSQQIEKCAQSGELAEQSLIEIQQFITSASEFKLSSPKEFRSIFQDSITPETKALVTQVVQRIDDVSLMCDKRIASLKKLTLKPKRPVQSVIPKPALPLQPPGGAPLFNKGNIKKLRQNSKMDIIVDNDSTEPNTFAINDAQNKELIAKRGHVLTELIETERVYVVELDSVIVGYRRQIDLEENQTLLPAGLLEKVDTLFGNLDEIYEFHSNIFLKDLENCLVSTDLVALCFVQRRDVFYRLYSYYCQNIPRSEQCRESLSDTQMFFHTCQMKLGHKLPLAAYLLKPVQRITKYQLLLKDLLRYSDNGKCGKELQQALDCMLVVLKLVNDSMHQIAIIGFPINLSQQGELLLQGSFSVWSENKRDLRLRLKPMQRHIFLYQKVMLFCKQVTKTISNKATYHFKFYLKMSDIGLTESVKGDTRKFEIWLQGRQEVHTIQALTVEQKQTWVNEIKKVLLNQLEELKGEKKKQYPALTHRPLSQMNSIESQQKVTLPLNIPVNINTDCNIPNNLLEDESMESNLWSSDCSNSEDEEVFTDHQNTTPTTQVGRYVALADYCASGHSEVSFREGDILELWKVGCAGWWFVKLVGTTLEGWAPSAYLESIHHRSSRSSSKSQDRLSDS